MGPSSCLALGTDLLRGRFDEAARRGSHVWEVQKKIRVKLAY